MELSADQIRTALTWAADADFEAKLDDADFALIELLAAELGEDPERWAGVYLSMKDPAPAPPAAPQHFDHVHVTRY